MDAMAIAGLVLVWNFPHVYGAAENRLFIEHGEYLPGRHFRVYHLWLAGLFAGSGFLVLVLSRSAWLTAAYLVYAPLGLDWVWWLIRYVDIRFLGRNDYDGGVGKAWHSRDDWDNYGGLPLLFGTYWWWYASGALSTVLGVVSLIG
ncbi:MAG: hypothetical protein ACE14S_00600 [Candidatus Bathyarchaeia archaeon]